MCVLCPGSANNDDIYIPLCRKCFMCRRHCECYGQGEQLASVTIHAIAELKPGPNAEWLSKLNIPGAEADQ